MPFHELAAVSDGYFSMLSIDLVEGRERDIGVAARLRRLRSVLKKGYRHFRETQFRGNT